MTEYHACNQVFDAGKTGVENSYKKRRKIMAFCKYCGKELKEGEVCSCQQAQAAAASSPATPVEETASTLQTAPASETASTPQAAPASETASTPQAAPSIDTAKLASTAKTVGGEYLKMWKSPAAAAKEMMGGTDKIAMICLIVIQALASSIFALCVAGKVNALMNSLLGGLGLFGIGKVSGVKAFFLTLLFSLIFAALWGLLFWLAGLITKAKLSLNQVFAVTAARAVIVAPMMLVSGILFLIVPGLGFALSFLSVLFVICVMVEMLRDLEGMTANKCVYIAFVTVLVFNLLFLWIGASALNLFMS